MSILITRIASATTALAMLSMIVPPSAFAEDLGTITDEGTTVIVQPAPTEMPTSDVEATTTPTSDESTSTESSPEVTALSSAATLAPLVVNDGGQFDLFTTGSINGQGGWTANDSHVDEAIVDNTTGPSSFGLKALRVSNAVTTGGFDQIFAPSLPGSVGESAATAGSFAVGTRNNHFEMSFDFASAIPNFEQSGLAVTLSPDRGDGSRMSYIKLADTPTGTDVIFFDVQGMGNPENFVATTVATGLDRTVAHNVKLTFDAIDGPSNDVVKVYVDGALVHTGTSWENYYRYDSEASAEQSPRLIKTILIRVNGTAVPANAGKGYLFDHFTTSASQIAVPTCSTDSNSFDTFTNGSVNGQNGWSSTGAYDQAIVSNVYGNASFGCKSLRISNAVTTGAFGDQTFSYSTPNEAGETTASSTGLSSGTRQTHFDAQFDLGSTVPGAQQQRLVISVSPDRGDGARMSYLRFEDQADGVHVFFDDFTNPTQVVDAGDFNETEIATLDRSVAHTIAFAMDFVDGPSNDVVTISIDGNPVHTGTSWEDYYLYDSEQAGGGNLVPTTDSLIFRTAGGAVPANQGNGFLIDNVVVTTPTPVQADTSTGNSGRSGSRSGSSSSAAVTTTTITGTTGTNTGTGQVLGASTYSFTADLHLGSRGTEVTELQNELIAAGYSIPFGATGYFGVQTRAAVAMWQKDHGVAPAAGYFGAISRAAYLAIGSLGKSTPIAMPMPTVTTSTTTATTTSTTTVSQ